MDLLLVRRRRLTDPPAPFRCACGSPVIGWNPPLERVARCETCERQPEYHLLKADVTVSGDAREWVIAACGVVEADKERFEAQGFEIVVPLGARFFPDVPTINGELTNDDGSLKT